MVTELHPAERGKYRRRGARSRKKENYEKGRWRQKKGDGSDGREEGGGEEGEGEA
jgi:hypothetical protein